jgi:hypothetical protein
MERRRWDAAEVAYAEHVRARPYDASCWLGRSELHMARGQFERAATDLAGAIRAQPDNPQLRYFHILSLLSQGDRFRTYRPSESPGRSWDEVEIRVLRREAEAVILYDPIFPADPFDH